MNKLSRMRRSRDSWKGKATTRAEQLRESRKTKARHQRRIESLKERIAALEHELLEEKKPSSPANEIVSIDEAIQTRLVCILLVVQAVSLVSGGTTHSGLAARVGAPIAAVGTADQLDGAFRISGTQPSGAGEHAVASDH